jgi:hypothetical protein
MRDVYSKAELCIAATGAESGDIGLFFDRDSEQLTPVMVEATWPSDDVLRGRPPPGSYLFGFHDVHSQIAIDHAPLNKRAWVAQERFLSPLTLHFTQSLLFWEYHTSFTSEHDQVPDSSRFTSRSNKLRESLNEIQWPGPNLEPIQNIALRSISNETKLRNIYRAWRKFLSQYTSCGITKESDILVALVGVADEVGHAMSDCLIAGLWKAQFVRELCWLAYGDTSRPSIWRAPSWSWASLSGRILHSPVERSHDPYNMAAVIKFCVSTKPSGKVEQGSVLVECRLVPGTIHYIGLKDWEPFFNARGTLDKSIKTSFSETINPSDLELTRVQLDAADAACYHADQAVDIQLLVLLIHNPLSDPGHLTIEGICVVESGTQAGAFERVGYFEAGDATAKLVLAAYDQARVQNILLI